MENKLAIKEFLEDNNIVFEEGSDWILIDQNNQVDEKLMDIDSALLFFTSNNEEPTLTLRVNDLIKNFSTVRELLRELTSLYKLEPLDEAKKKRKKSKRGFGWFDSLNPNAGDPAINAAFFNAASNASESPSTSPMGPMGEGLEGSELNIRTMLIKK